MIKERLAKLRALMAQKEIAYYIVPTNDYHLSEYVGAHFGARKYMSGFTGSAGVLLVGMEEAGLWTDGRYYIQAENQLKGSTITLFKQGTEGVPLMEEYLKSVLKDGENIGFDGRVLPAKTGIDLENYVLSKGGNVLYDFDLVGQIWEERPALASAPAWVLEEKYTGESVASKLDRVRKVMADRGAAYHVLTMLDDVAYLYNMRGDDIPSNPIVLSYTVIGKDCAWLFVDETKLNADLNACFKANNVEVLPYNAVYEWLKTIPEGAGVMYNQSKVNYAIDKNIPVSVRKIDCENPTVMMKAVKNDTEINNLIQAHIKDGVAFTKFMYWLKNNIGKIDMTEISASDYLEECRRAQEGFIELSFNTISAYKANAAMMHYSASAESNAVLEPEGLYLVDSGGHYYEGSTDITRTMALGPVEDEIKKHFTAVLRGMLNLQNARFLYGCIGMNLDILARGPVWDMNIDYRCGTGHGVGYLLGIHEPPNGFRWKRVPERDDSAVLEAGMVTSNEPGVYEEGSHGIRIENEIVCRKGEKNEYGQFMYFEPITFAPIDLDAVDVQYMTSVDKERLNNYHKLVYDTLSPYMTEEENVWLKEYTRSI